MEDSIKKTAAASFDRELSKEEQKELAEALNRSEELRREKEALQHDEALLSKYEAAFGEGFAQKVSERWFSQTQTDFYPLFKKILLGAAAAILLMLFSAYYTDGDLSASSLLGLSDLSSDEILFALSSF